MKVADSSGFTLIELVVVIVILGILAATALPRFINLSKDAELSVFNAFLGSVKSGASLYQLKWRASGGTTTPPAGATSTPSLLGFPAGGNNLNTAFESDCRTIWTDLIEDANPSLPFITATNNWGNTISKTDWASNASQIVSLGESQDNFCHFVYVKAYFSGSFSGATSERIPAIQYNIVTGEIRAVDWPYTP